MMLKSSGERLIPFFLFAISLTNPDEVVLLMIASLKSRFSSGSWAAYWIAGDFLYERKVAYYNLKGSQSNRSFLTF